MAEVAKIIWFLVLKKDGVREHRHDRNILDTWTPLAIQDFHWPQSLTSVSGLEGKIG